MLLKVAVVGGGIGGLALASSLCRHPDKFDVRVYERRRGPAESGTGMVLWPNGIRALRQLQVELEKDGKAVGAEQKVVLVGERTVPQQFPEDARAVMVAWRDLRDALLQRVPAGRVVYDRAITGIEGGNDGKCKVRFEGRAGRSAQQIVEVDLLVGADGIRSSTRALLEPRSPAMANRSELSDDIIDAGRVVFRAIISSRAHPQLATYCPEGAAVIKRLVGEDGLSVAFMDVGQDQMYWAIVMDHDLLLKKLGTEVWKVPEKCSDAAARDALVALITGSDSDKQMMRALLHATAQGDLYVSRNLSRKPTFEASWTGTFPQATLLGDSMHAVLPSYGQGACLALEDAAVLSQMLVNASPDNSHLVQECLRVYETERLKRTAQIQIASFKSGAEWRGTSTSFYNDKYEFLDRPQAVVPWMWSWGSEAHSGGPPRATT